MKFSIAVVLTLFPVLLSQPAPPQAGASDTSKLGSVQDRVVNVKTGQPVKKASITLRPSGAPRFAASGSAAANSAPYAGITDSDGKFRIDKVDPGTYRLSAERQRFIRREYGARRNSMIGTPVTVAAAQDSTALNIDLIPQAVISGRVVDEDGEPLARVQIQVMHRQFVRGKLQYFPAGAAPTLDNGEFWMFDLAPGQYWMNAVYRGRMIADEPVARNLADRPEEEYVTTFYPGSVSQDGARPIDLGPGQELTGIHIRMQKQKVYRIKGKVGGGTTPLRNIRLTASPRGVFMNTMNNFGTMVRQDGSFELASLTPGSYYVTVTPMQGQGVTTRVPVDITERNVDNIVIPLATPQTLKGTVRLEPDAEQPPQPDAKPVSYTSSVQLSVADGMMFNLPSGSVKEDGSFTIENIGPDKYRIAVSGLPQGTWLKAIRTEDQEVLDSGLDLSGGSPASLQITLGVGAAQVGGTVLDSKQHPAPSSVVALLPDPMKEDRADLYRMATTDQSGQFSMKGITPGEYRLMKLHESKGQKISVKANREQQVSLTQIEAVAATAK